MAPPKAAAEGSGTSGILVDVVALIRAGDPVHTAKPALTSRLLANGAKVVQRLGREVTHIIYERRHSQRPRDKTADEAELLELYKRLDKARRAAALHGVLQHGVLTGSTG